MSANPYLQNDWQAKKCTDWLMYSDSVVPFIQRQVWSLRTTISVISVRQYRDISFCLIVTWHMQSTWHMILSSIWLQDKEGQSYVFVTFWITPHRGRSNKMLLIHPHFVKSNTDGLTFPWPVVPFQALAFLVLFMSKFPCK